MNGFLQIEQAGCDNKHQKVPYSRAHNLGKTDSQLYLRWRDIIESGRKNEIADLVREGSLCGCLEILSQAKEMSGNNWEAFL